MRIAYTVFVTSIIIYVNTIWLVSLILNGPVPYFPRVSLTSMITSNPMLLWIDEKGCVPDLFSFS